MTRRTHHGRTHHVSGRTGLGAASRRIAFALLGVLPFWLPSANALEFNLGKLGDVVKSVIENKDAFLEVSEAREVEIGQGLSARLLGAVPLVKDDRIQAYVSRVGLWVALQSQRPGLPWTFGVLDTKTVNAFAAPGGFVFITSGLMATLSNEAELAGVLAHEISHVVKRHHLAALQTVARTRLGAEVAATIATDARGLSDALVNAGVELFAKGLDQGDELEADARGVVLAARAGYDPYGLAAVLEALAAREATDEYLTFMLSTHPSAADRLESLDANLDDRFDSLASAGTVEPRFVRNKKRIK
jgi:predicted Zn-dependent protease